MYEELDGIILYKPLEEATYPDLCKGTPRQRSLKEMKEASLEELKATIGNDELAEIAFNAIKKYQYEIHPFGF